MSKPPKRNANTENIVAEMLVLGKILQSDHSFWAVSDVLQVQHFAEPVHRDIYQHCTDIYMGGGKIYTTAVLESRIGPEYGDGLSTANYLQALRNQAEKEENALDQVDSIIQCWQQRKAAEAADKFRKEVSKPEVIVGDKIAELILTLQDITLNSQAEPLKSIGDIARKAMAASKTAKQSGILPGFDSGLPTLDQILGRIHGGDLGFCYGAPGDGKSVWGAQIANRAAVFGPVLYHQLEMKDVDMARRALAGETNVSVADIESGAYNFEEAEQLDLAMDKLDKRRVYIDDRPKLFVEQICERAKHVKRAKGLICVVVDHLRLVRTFQKTTDRFQRAEVVTGELKALAKDLDIAVIVLSQVTRASQRREDPVPQLTDADGGSSVDQDADWALALFRRDRWLKKQRPQDMDSKEGKEWSELMVKHRGLIEVHVQKRRRGEDGEMRQFQFLGRRGLFAEIEK